MIGNDFVVLSPNLTYLKEYNYILNFEKDVSKEVLISMRISFYNYYITYWNILWSVRTVH